MFKARSNDIIVTTTQKYRTIWVQKIVSLLIFQNEDPPGPFHDISTYVDMRLSDCEELARTPEAQNHRGFLRT